MGKKKTAAKRPAAKAGRTKSKPAKSKANAAPGIRDRVVDLRRVKACELRPHPDNWRKHPEGQRSALRDLLAEIGFADVILARELPDKALQIIDGHLRVEEAGESEVPVLVLDLDETEARKLLATLDPLAGAAELDPETFARLSEQIETESEAIRALLEEILSGESPDDEEQGDNTATGEPDLAPESFEVIVECADEDDQRATYEKLIGEGRKCRLLTL